MTEEWQRGFYRRSLAQRQTLLAHGRDLGPLGEAQLQINATPEHDLVIENYVTDYRVPEGLVLGLVVNGQPYTVPMATEEPSVIAAASNGAKRVAQSGGFTAVIQERQMIGQVVLQNVTEPDHVITDLLMHKAELLQLANAARPSMQKRGGGAPCGH